jgi:tetratricopeptide (TPR) repeat protein
LHRSFIISGPTVKSLPNRYLQVTFGSSVGSSLNPYASADSVSADTRSRAQSRIGLGLEHAAQGQIDEALSDFREARKIYPNLQISANDWNSLCWDASLHDRASAVVDDACQNAVALDPNNIEALDSRGLALALNGQRQQAISDWTVYVNSRTVPEDRKVLRRRWIERLRVGENPLSAQELNHLREAILHPPLTPLPQK